MTANLTYHAPNTATVQPVTPAKYASLLTSIQGNTGAINFAHNGNAGSVSFNGVQFAWSYDGISVLNLNIVAVHSQDAKIAGNQAIFGRLQAQLLSGLS